jgi:hypothetical protein
MRIGELVANGQAAGRSAGLNFLYSAGKVEARKEVVEIESADCDLHTATPLSKQGEPEGIRRVCWLRSPNHSNGSHHHNRHIIVLQRSCLVLGYGPDQLITYHLSR